MPAKEISRSFDNASACETIVLKDDLGRKRVITFPMLASECPTCGRPNAGHPTPTPADLEKDIEAAIAEMSAEEERILAHRRARGYEDNK